MEELKATMMSGEQSPGVDYYAHGLQVRDKFCELMNLMKEGKAAQHLPSKDPPFRWSLPKWIVQHQKQIFEQLQSKQSLYETYQTWHDCGKPFVKQVDKNNDVHYPDHAAVSAAAWLAAGGDEQIANLIRDDMIPHNLRTVAEARQLALHNSNFLILMVTAVCALHVCIPQTSEICDRDITATIGFKIKMQKLAYFERVMMQVLVHVNNKTGV